MSSTNKTTNYELSQFVGSDKPAWLADYNQDMSKIDTGIHNAATTATGADGKADANTASIGTLSSLTTTAKTDLVSAVNEVNTSAGTAQNSANTANGKAEANALSIQNLVATLNINTYLSYGTSDFTSISNATATSSAQAFTVARNSDGSLFKVYGDLVVTPNASGTPVTIRLSNTGISPDSSYTIKGCGIAYRNNNSQLQIQPVTLEVGSGTIDITFTPNAASTSFVIRLWACLYFNGDFGDIVPSE